jgi:hypothetical protein
MISYLVGKCRSYPSVYQPIIPNLLHVRNQISEIKLCENEVEDVLKVINPTKASGPDLISPRLLKEAARTYY